VLERRRAVAAACQVRSPVPRAAEGEQAVAGWPPWLVAVAPEAVRGWVPRRADSFEKLDKVRPHLQCFALALVSSKFSPLASWPCAGGTLARSELAQFMFEVLVIDMT
jgi:hypothetical protein